MTDRPICLDEDDVQARMSALTERLHALRSRIEAAGGEAVEILAVSKGQPLEAVVAACRLGLGPLGESYAQEFVARADQLDELGVAQPIWHFVGQLQTNKVRLVADRVALWQSVDRLKVGREIAKRAPGARVFAQANLSGDPNKAGCALTDIDELVTELDTLGLRVEGLMGVGTAADDERTRHGFEALRTAVDRCGLRHCSMGMSADLELAVAAGSTMVRVGSDVFGPRP